MESVYLSVEDVADIFGKSKKWVYERKADIPGFFKLAGIIFFDREILFESLRKAAFRPPTRKRPGAHDDRHGLLAH